MVMCSTDFEADVNEFDVSELTAVSSQKIMPPRVGESKISFECTLDQIVEVGDGKAGSGFLVIGTIILFHIDDDIYDNGHILIDKLNPIGRLAGNWYTRTTDTLKIVRNTKPDQ